MAYSQDLSEIRSRRSRRLWPVGPVTTVSPRAVNKGQALKARSDCSGSKPNATARATVVGSAMAPALGVLPSMPSEPGAEHGEHFAGMMGQFKRAGQGKLLIAAASARGAVHRDGDLAAGDEAEAAMKRAQIVEAVEQIAGGISVVPVVAGVVDGHEVTGFLREHPRTLDKIVARKQEFKDRIAKGLVFAGEVHC